jgi:hypothetical protein
MHSAEYAVFRKTLKYLKAFAFYFTLRIYLQGKRMKEIQSVFAISPNIHYFCSRKMMI